MEIEERPRPIRSVRYGSKEVRVLLGEHIALLDGPDVLQIEIKKVRRAARTGPVEGDSHRLAVIDCPGRRARVGAARSRLRIARTPAAREGAPMTTAEFIPARRRSCARPRPATSFSRRRRCRLPAGSADFALPLATATGSAGARVATGVRALATRAAAGRKAAPPARRTRRARPLMGASPAIARQLAVPATSLRSRSRTATREASRGEDRRPPSRKPPDTAA
jgi:hypothetical protein